MKVDIETLKDTFELGYAEFEESRKEAAEVYDLYHNRHYNRQQLALLKNRGQPAETFNVIKMLARMYVGYFSSVVSTIKTLPRGPYDVERAYLLNDTVQYVFEDNDWLITKDKAVLDMVLTGLSCTYVDAQDMGMTDDFGRKLYSVGIDYVDPTEIVLDPMSIKEDNSDARFTHRFKWISEETFIALFGKHKLKKVQAYYNFTGAHEADFTDKYSTEFNGQYKRFDNYLIVHTIIKDDKGQVWSIYWNNDTILSKEKYSADKVTNPYRIIRTSHVDRAEYYGLMREVVEPQKAINQAVIQIQLMINSKRIMGEPDAVENVDEFNQLVNRVNTYIPVLDLQGIRIEDMSADIAQQYLIIDKNMERIHKVLSINESFLGNAMASDSGRKVKLQQNASVTAMRYITNRIEFMYMDVGRTVVDLIKQYYTANQIFSVAEADSDEMRKFVETNRPFLMPTGRLLPGGQPEVEPVIVEANPDRDANEPMELQMINEANTDLSLADVRVKVVTAQYNDSDDIERMFLDSLTQGMVGQATLNADPASFFQMAAMSAEAAKTRTSDKISSLLKEVSQKLGGTQTRDPREVSMQQAGQANNGSAPQTNGGAMMDAAGMTKMGGA